MKEISFCNFTQDSKVRSDAGKVSFPKLFPKDSVGEIRGYTEVTEELGSPKLV